MINYILKRLLMLFPVLILVSIISFSVIYISPGDAAQNALTDPSGGYNQQSVDEFKNKMGLNEPIYIQYINWMKNVLTGKLGYSYMTNESVFSAISRSFRFTFELAVVSMFVSLIIALPLGIISALKPNSIIDDMCRFIGLIGVSIPNFWQAYMLIIIFSLTFKILPSSGYGNGNLMYMILPAITLGTGYAAVTMRLIRSSMLDVLKQDYIRAAKAKGIPEHIIILKHAFKNSLIPVVTVAGLNFGSLLNGSVIVETIFAWPGLGNLMVSSILSKDYPVIQGCILFIALIFMLINFTVDMTYAFLNPKIRYDNKI